MYSSSYGGGPGFHRSPGNNCPPYPGNFLASPRPYMDQRMLRVNSPPSFSYSNYGSTEPSVHRYKCGELRTSNAGETIEIAGRVSKLQSCRFLHIRDDSGVTQLVASDERTDLQKRMRNLPLESYVAVRGQVILRPETARNRLMTTGDVEVVIHEFLTIQKKRTHEDDDDTALGRSKTKQHRRGSERVTTDELMKAENAAMRSYFSARTHTCGDISASLASKELSLCGWVQLKRPPRFIVLKDGHGELQLVCAGSNVNLHSLQVGAVIFVRGILGRRPAFQGNPRSPNGAYELSVTELTHVTRNSPLLEGYDDPPASEEIKVEGDSALPCSAESQRDSEPTLNTYTLRTHTCGELRSSNVGETVTLTGWMEFTRMNKFFTLRDAYGETQIIISDSNEKHSVLLNNLSFESVLSVTGTVSSRPPSQVKTHYPTGEIEVLASSLEVVNRADVLPFNIRGFQRPNEALRLQYRYLDLRFQKMQRNLRLRSSTIMKMREFLINHHGFVEVETPTLFARTPGGAREFIVPTHKPNQFYSLVQSPQQLKQLLMVGAVDRYFQVARCYRDENSRPDRQLEFTQLDIELSFCKPQDVMQLIEDLLRHCWPQPEEILTPFPRMTYQEAMQKYGTDKPDLTYDWEIVNVSDIFKVGCYASENIQLQEKAQSGDFAACALCARKGGVRIADVYKKASLKHLKALYPLVTPLIINVVDLNSLKKDLSRLLGEAIGAEIFNLNLASDTDALFIAYGPETQVLQCLGKMRTDIADAMEGDGAQQVRTRNQLKFLWVTDFPLFTKNEEGTLESSHHPFTAPIPGHEEKLLLSPATVIGQHYDLVLNGCEVGGGSIRIHDGDLQEKVLKDVLDIPVDPLKHLLQALRSGAPPHGGIALGLDRLIAIMAGEKSIRDVIAFPKNSEGKDPLTGAPSPLEENDLKYYHLTSAPKENEMSQV